MNGNRRDRKRAAKALERLENPKPEKKTKHIKLDGCCNICNRKCFDLPNSICRDSMFLKFWEASNGDEKAFQKCSKIRKEVRRKWKRGSCLDFMVCQDNKKRRRDYGGSQNGCSDTKHQLPPAPPKKKRKLNRRIQDD